MNNDTPPPTPPQPSLAPPAPTPEPRKSWFSRHKVLTGLLALVLIAGASQAVNSDGYTTPVGATAADAAPAEPKADDAVDTQPKDKEAKQAEPKAEDAADSEKPKADDDAAGAAQIGTAVRDGEFEFTVTRVQKNVASVGGEYLKEKAQGKYVILHVTVKNVGEKAQLLSDSEQKVRDGSGREFSTDTAAGIYIEDNKVFFNEINPGNSVKGQLVFDMPKGASPATVELHDSMFSDGVTVSLR